MIIKAWARLSSSIHKVILKLPSSDDNLSLINHEKIHSSPPNLSNIYSSTIVHTHETWWSDAYSLELGILLENSAQNQEIYGFFVIRLFKWCIWYETTLLISNLVRNVCSFKILHENCLGFNIKYEQSNLCLETVLTLGLGIAHIRVWHFSIQISLQVLNFTWQSVRLQCVSTLNPVSYCDAEPLLWYRLYLMLPCKHIHFRHKCFTKQK